MQLNFLQFSLSLYLMCKIEHFFSLPLLCLRCSQSFQGAFCFICFRVPAWQSLVLFGERFLLALHPLAWSKLRLTLFKHELLTQLCWSVPLVYQWLPFWNIETVTPDLFPCSLPPNAWWNLWSLSQRRFQWLLGLSEMYHGISGPSFINKRTSYLPLKVNSLQLFLWHLSSLVSLSLKLFHTDIFPKVISLIEKPEDVTIYLPLCNFWHF